MGGTTGTEGEREWEGWEVGRVDSDEVKDKQEGDVLYPLGVRKEEVRPYHTGY